MMFDNEYLDLHCDNCGHIYADHTEEGDECWNGSGVGNKCECTQYEHKR